MTGPAHSTLGASGAYRWMTCPGSVALSEGIERRDTVFSREGTAAHTLAETAITMCRTAHSYIGEYMEGVKVTEEMAQAVQVYVDYVNGRKKENGTLMLEHRFSLEKLNPPVPMFGTADAIIIQPKYKRLLVIDYKHGAGEVVHVHGNKQLRYYALGALLSMEKIDRIETIEIVIIQPRAAHSDGPIRSETVTVTEVLDFAQDLIEAAIETTKPGARLESGKHCKFCPAQPKCPELHKQAQLVAADEFQDRTLTKPELLTPAQLQFILSKADTIEAWLKSIRDHVTEEIKKGKDVPGFKLVSGRPSRYWNDHDAVIAWAKENSLDDEIFKTELKSVSAIEKIVGKKNLPADLVSSVSKTVTLVSEDDKRPALTFTAGQEFSALSESTRENGENDV